MDGWVDGMMDETLDVDAGTDTVDGQNLVTNVLNCFRCFHWSNPVRALHLVSVMGHNLARRYGPSRRPTQH